MISPNSFNLISEDPTKKAYIQNRDDDIIPY